MSPKKQQDHKLNGDELVRQDLITREELDEAKAREVSSGTPWYKQLIQQQKITFQTLENVLRYEFHSKASRSVHQTLGETLLEMGAISEEQLVKALADQKRNGRLLGNIMLENGFTTREDIAIALSRQYDMEYTSLEETPSEMAALHLVPESLALKNLMLPVSFSNDDKITVLVTSPQHRERLKDVAVLLGKRIHAVLTACEDMEAQIRARYEKLAETEAEGKEESATVIQPSKTKDADKSKKKTAEAAIQDSKTRFEEVSRDRKSVV